MTARVMTHASAHILMLYVLYVIPTYYYICVLGGKNNNNNNLTMRSKKNNKKKMFKLYIIHLMLGILRVFFIIVYPSTNLRMKYYIVF